MWGRRSGLIYGISSATGHRLLRAVGLRRIPDLPPCEIYCHSLSDDSILGDTLRASGTATLTLFGLHMPTRLFTADNDAAREQALTSTLASLDSVLAEPLSGVEVSPSMRNCFGSGKRKEAPSRFRCRFGIERRHGVTTGVHARGLARLQQRHSSGRGTPRSLKTCTGARIVSGSGHMVGAGPDLADEREGANRNRRASGDAGVRYGISRSDDRGRQACGHQGYTG